MNKLLNMKHIKTFAGEGGGGAPALRGPRPLPVLLPLPRQTATPHARVEGRDLQRHGQAAQAGVSDAHPAV